MPKSPKSHDEQLAILWSRGLVIPDLDDAAHWLLHHNYYRFSAYRFPFTVHGNPNEFLPGVTFDQVRNLYRFDAGLRRLLFEGCKRVEISVRTRWAYEVGHQLGPIGYLNNVNFTDPLVHARALASLDAEMKRSNEEFIRHHQVTLREQWPPAWVICEVASFGTLSKLLSNTTPPRLRQDIADSYDLDEKTLCSLIHHVIVLRNMAAHHARIWNKTYTFKVALPKTRPKGLAANFYHPPGINPQKYKIYNTLVLLVHMVQQIDPTADWPERLLVHLDTLDPSLIPAMGFPPDWRTRPLWQTLAPSGYTP